MIVLVQGNVHKGRGGVLNGREALAELHGVPELGQQLVGDGLIRLKVAGVLLQDLASYSREQVY